MIPKMRRANPPIDPAEVTDFERHVSITFPKDYLDFLLKTNGGQPFKSGFSIGDGSTSSVQVFLGIGVPTPTSELDYVYELYGEALPQGVVAIACDSGSNYVCLDLRSGLERVAFWDKSHFWSTGEWREKDLIDVASSFREFLMLLDTYEAQEPSS